MDFEKDIVESLKVLRAGGIILYPTDTIWGIGGDATNPKVINRINTVKNRKEGKGMIILLADARDLMKYVAAPDPEVFDYLDTIEQPTTIVFDGAIGLPDSLLQEDGSIGIRIVKDSFCRHLIKRLGQPLLSTSANSSGSPAPENFMSIDEEIKKGVDYIVTYRQDENTTAPASRVIKWEANGSLKVLRN